MYTHGIIPKFIREDNELMIYCQQDFSDPQEQVGHNKIMWEPKVKLTPQTLTFNGMSRNNKTLTKWDFTVLL